MSTRVEVIDAAWASADPLAVDEPDNAAAAVDETLEELPDEYRAVAISYDEVVMLVGTRVQLEKLAEQILTAARAARGRGEGAIGG